jgi:CRP-like cAMP-binding protein
MWHRSLAPQDRELHELAAFAQCSPHQLSGIGSLCTPADVRSNRTLCAQDEIARECFVVVAGSAVASIDGHVVGRIERGEFVGELALLAPGGRRTATVTTETEMSLLVFTRSEFSAMIVALPRVSHVILREAVRRLLHNAAALEGAKSCPPGLHPRLLGRRVVSL